METKEVETETLLITDIHQQSDSTITVRTNDPDVKFEYWASGDAKYSHITDYKWINQCYGKPLISINYDENQLKIHGVQVIQIFIEPLDDGDKQVYWNGKPYGI